MIAMLHLHPSLDRLLVKPAVMRMERVEGNDATALEAMTYLDSFGNRCTRFLAPAGVIRLSGQSTLEMAAEPDPWVPGLTQAPIEELPTEVLQFLLASRYCQVDQMIAIANDLFGYTTPGWPRATFIREWVHDHVAFNYNTARTTKTALDVFTERVGVCRDFQHLAITLSRAMNIPARYVTGYLGDIRYHYSGAGDFSAWYEVFLAGRWWTMDARHNNPRYGRVMMATGRDATDVAITTSFGIANLTHFYVESNEIDEAGNRVPLLSPPGAFAVVTPVAMAAPAGR